MKPQKRSFFTLVCIILAYVCSFFYYQMWQFGVKGGDPLGYYTYLPATLLYQDLSTLNHTNLARAQQFKKPILESFYEDNGLVQPQENGNRVLKYTCGLAITVAPFFIIAHIVAPVLGYVPNGFSPIYLFAFYLAGLFYALWGLYILRNILLRYFEDSMVAWVLLLIGLGTNLYFFAVYHSVMVHATLFFLHVLVLYQTILLYEQPTRAKSLLLGIALGLIILIRPIEIIVVFIPLLWGLPNLKKSTLAHRWQFLKEQKQLLQLIIATTFFFGLPQFLYWFTTTGSPVYYSYGEEGFNFLNPQIIKGLFSYANGWLAYTPMMYFALIGLFFLYKNKGIFYPVLFFLIAHIYIIYSWWCWNYINGFGSRPMVEAYGLLSFPLAYYWDRIQSIKPLWILSIGISFLFLFLNIFNTWQFSKGLMWSESAKLEYYISMIGKTSMDYEDLIVYDCGEFQPDTLQLSNYTTLYWNDFEKEHSILPTTKTHRKLGNQSCHLTPLPEKVELFRKQAADLPISKGQYLKASVWAMKETGSTNIYESSILAIRFEDKNGKGIKTRRIRLNNKIANPTNNFWGNWEGFIWDEIYFFSKIPRLPKEAEVVLYLENKTNTSIYVDALKLEVTH